MRKLPTVLAFAFIVITLFRVAAFASNRMYAGWLGWVFSIGLGAGVYLSSYYTRENITRKDDKVDQRDKNVQVWAWAALVFFMLVDAAFNILEVWLSVNPKTLEIQVSTALYGAFPTLAAGLLGALQGHIDKLPNRARVASADKTPSIAAAFRRLILARVASWTKRIKQGSASPVKEPVKSQTSDAQEPKEERKLPPLEGNRLAIYNLINRHPTISDARVAQEVDLSRQRVGQIKQELVKTGYLHPNGKSH